MNSVIKRYILPLVICAGVLISCGSAPSSSSSGSSGPNDSSKGNEISPQTQAERDRRQIIYMDFLRQEGYVPSLDKDNDITFKQDGNTFYVYIGKSDPSYVSVMRLNVWAIRSDAERRKAADAASYACRRTKSAKAYIDGSKDQFVSFATEIYFENPNDFGILCKRMINAVNSAVNNFESQL